MILLIVSIIASLGIVGLGLAQGRKCFDAYNHTIDQVNKLTGVLQSCAEGVSFKEVLGGWARAEDPTVSRMVRSMLRFLEKEPLRLNGRLGWVVDLENLCDAKLNFRAHPGFGKTEVMPGVLTGIGILFTFLGLSVGIFGLDPTNAEQLTSGVKRLLGGMSLAFLTSIAGLATSLWWIWRNKLTRAAFDGAFSECLLTLQTKPFLLVPEEMNYQLLEHQAAQTKALADMGETFYKAAGRAFEDAGFGEIRKLLEKVSDNRGVNDILELLRVELTNLNRSSSENSEINRKLNRAINILVKTQNEQGAANGGAVAGLVEGSPEQVVANLGKIHQAQTVAVSGIQDAAAELHKLLKTAKVASADIARVHRHVKEHLEQLNTHWQNYQQNLQNMQGTLENTLKTFGEDMNKSLVEAHGQVDGLLAQSLTHFSGTLENLQATVDALAMLVQKADEGGSAKGLLGRLNR